MNAERQRGRPRTATDAERRKSILKAAHAAFVELGFARTTTAVVAAKANISKRTIYAIFDDKTALFAAVIREHRHLILDLPRPAGDDLPVFETMVRIFRLDIDETAEREREAILNLIVRESARFPELSDYLYENNILRSREELIEWLNEQTRCGRMTVEDPAMCAGMLMDIVFGALLPRRRIKKGADRTRRVEDIKKRLKIFLRGTGTQK
ncbi:TetR/AcrR family transcriptional regulator [Agrobacterium tumefaciens]|uniref:TetR/AcrR family transcriptional regulator n=1 Tax=Agrobacterium tumefaciens TaxID=358 RepID=A0AAP9J990_AGRTU|nr:TetR/AcrR family transcriptional regulator [Agrobacterium tumefaciens]NSZ61032.1 TetR/AcrR family transcriptional regulator [Agrobacterium tumefaciens]QDY97771.1 TetR/AcrR family transcriptional regulator [Agrobacterium tumefaciens]UXS12893.1 TetR/AcrR family transcriptional regulator [Agrobacterium tumefaciens]UXS20255.1 TetR/AcrR family transcriptional regulator [Agrobacterium tumefaciens]UXS27900.1 TetR/AcrR family transcriptional regulator [Agrobacterium tumefaciens]